MRMGQRQENEGLAAEAVLRGIKNAAIRIERLDPAAPIRAPFRNETQPVLDKVMRRSIPAHFLGHGKRRISAAPSSACAWSC